MSLGERRSRLAAAAEALDGLDEVLFQASAAELAEWMGLADTVAAKAGAARISVTVEAVARGEVAEAGTNVHAWVREHAPSLRQGGAGQVAAVAVAVRPVGSLSGSEGADRVDPGSPLRLVWAGVREGSVSASLAGAALREMSRIEPLLRDEAKPTVMTALLELGTAWGPAMMRRLRPRLLAQYGLTGVLDDLQERLAPAARLSAPMVESGDLTEYQLLMTPEQAAALEAAIGPLSAPAPNEETGERDLRPAGQRRVEALTEVCRRSSADDAAGCGKEGAGAAASAVYVTVSLEDLQARTGCGEVLASSATGNAPLARGTPADQLRRRPHPVRAGHGGGGAGPRPGGPAVHSGPAATAVAPRQGVHVPGVWCAGGLDEGTPRGALGRRRPVRPRQRGAAVPAAPHVRPLATVARAGPGETG